LLIASVAGRSLVPDPPAKMMPFIIELLAIYSTVCIEIDAWLIMSN
jgi:hypothetical protein